MVRNPDDSSFVSWTATLHPESAVSSVDPRSQTASAWATVYHETCGGESSENVPIAVQVIPLDIEDQPHPQHEGRHHCDPESQMPCHEENSGTNEHCSIAASKPQPWRHSSLIDLIIGFSLALASFIWTIKIEIGAIVVYTLAVGFHFLADEIFSSTPMLLPKSICLTLTAVLMIVDAVLLTISVLVTEVLGGVAFLLCTVFGGPRSGTEWHQFIRKACHMTRWGFRSCHKGWKPARVFPISMEEEREQFHHQEQLRQQQQDMDPDNDNGHDNCSHGQYCDVPPPRSPTEATYASEDDMSTLTDTARYTVTIPSDPETPATPPPPQAGTIAMIEPENVIVLGSEEQEGEEGAEDMHFIKNTQQVVIT